MGTFWKESGNIAFSRGHISRSRCPDIFVCFTDAFFQSLHEIRFTIINGRFFVDFARLIIDLFLRDGFPLDRDKTSARRNAGRNDVAVIIFYISNNGSTIRCQIQFLCRIGFFF